VNTTRSECRLSGGGRGVAAWAIVAMAATALAGQSALAQTNPLEVDKPSGAGGSTGAPTTPPETGPGGLLNDPGAQVAKLYVPDWIKPGVRLVYTSGSSQESSDPTKPPSAAVGWTRFDVVAVTDTHVLMVQSSYLDRGAGGPTYAASSPLRVNAMEVIGGAALWTSPEAMEAMRTHPEFTVLEGPMQINGNTYETISYTRMTADMASRKIFDKGTGLKLAEQLGSGPSQRTGDPTGFHRQVNSQMQFQTFRQVPLPWLEGAAPEWSKTATTMRYQGSQTLTQVNGPPISLPFTFDVKFSERGDQWAVGTATMQMQGQQAQSQPIITGVGRVGAYWMSPESLASMRPGALDQDPALGITLGYDVQDTGLGRLGLIVEKGPGYQLVWGYRMSDGALVYANNFNQELNLTIEVTLLGVD
jgi:hypothetical protein